VEWIGVGIAVLGIGVPAAVGIAKLVPPRNGRPNGELREIHQQLSGMGITVARIDERVNAHAANLKAVSRRLDTMVNHIGLEE
jgi:phosphoglycerate dehydrogenase-like enzyme